MAINYWEEGKYDGERGWPETPPSMAGLENWIEYTEGYKEGRNKPLPGVKKQYTAQERHLSKRLRIILAIILIIILFAILRFMWWTSRGI